MGEAIRLRGSWLAKVMQERMRVRVEELSASRGRRPGLGVILVGEDPASRTYVASKEKTARACGLESFSALLPARASADEVAHAIEKFNRDPRIDGILLQLPLPHGMSSEPLLTLIDPAKDADGLHPLNQGYLFQGRARVVPCTPLGIMHLIDLAVAEVLTEEGNESRAPAPRASLRGMNAVVVGRSLLVGKPVAHLLLERDATVTIAHSKTADLVEVCRRSDIVVAAVGVANMIKGEWIRPGAIVIDVGINRTAEGTLCGDVDIASVSKIARAVTPVPGGVGPMTVTMLIHNTVEKFASR